MHILNHYVLYHIQVNYISIKQENRKCKDKCKKKIFANHIVESLRSIIYKELLKCNNKIITQLKKYKGLKQTFSTEDIQMANKHIKNVQYHQLLRKCKSIPQCITISHLLEHMQQKLENNKCWEGCGEIEILIHFWWECAAAVENSLAVVGQSGENIRSPFIRNIWNRQIHRNGK